MRTNSRVADMAEWFGRSGGGGDPGKDSHAAPFFGEVMKAPRRPARSLLTPSFIEELESRQLLSATLTGGTLTVTGTNKADNISIKAAGNSVVVKLNKGRAQTFTRSAVKQLVVSGGAGDDKITVNGAFNDATIDGGAGNDRIKGSGGGALIT